VMLHKLTDAAGHLGGVQLKAGGGLQDGDPDGHWQPAQEPVKDLAPARCRLT
jgi:hypothetical protein